MDTFLPFGLMDIISLCAGISLLSAGLSLRHKSMKPSKTRTLGSILACWGIIWVTVSGLALVIQYMIFQALIDLNREVLATYSMALIGLKLAFLVISAVIPWVIVFLLKD